MFRSRYFNFALLVIATVTSLMTVYRSSHGSNDFDTYYLAGRAVLDHSGIYFQGDYYRDALKGGPFLYAPILAICFASISWMPIQLAAVIWNLFNLLNFILSLHLINQLLDSSQVFEIEKINKKSRPYDFLIVGFLLLLLIDNLTMAQINIFILFLILCALYLKKRGADFWSGVFLAAAVLIKLTPVLFCVYFAFKRSWKMLGGVLVGGLIMTLLIPTLVFGYSESRLYHRQWLGRMLKPSLNTVLQHWKRMDIHPLKINPKQIENIRLSNLLTAKNQALEAALTRLFLKDRNHYADHSELPIYPAQKYRRLPVLIGLDPQILSLLIKLIQCALGFLMVFLIARNRFKEDFIRASLEVSIVFLSMTLFSPLARSHQFILWSFPLITLLSYLKNIKQTTFFYKACTWGAAILYLLQAVPYGKAAGMGAWSNLVLWIAFCVALFRYPADLKPMPAIAPLKNSDCK